MRAKIIPIRDLLPIELNCNMPKYKVLEYSRYPVIFDIIPVVPITINWKRRYITGDGNKRVLSRLVRGEEELELAIMENDKDIICCSTGAYHNYFTLQEFRDTYTRHWRPSLLEEGIHSFYDYKLLRDLRAEKK